MNASQRRISRRATARTFVPGLSVILPSGKLGTVCPGMGIGAGSVLVRRGDNRRVWMKPCHIKLAV